MTESMDQGFSIHVEGLTPSEVMQSMRRMMRKPLSDPVGRRIRRGSGDLFDSANSQLFLAVWPRHYSDPAGFGL